MRRQGPLGRRLVAEIRLDRAMNLDGQRVAVAVFGIPRGDADPALADAIFLDIGFLGALEADTDVAREQFLVVVRAARIGRQAVRKRVGRGFAFLVHSSASISFLNPSGVTVGAWRPTTLPDRSTTNLVKFHLIDDPKRPDFSRFRYSYSGCALPPLTSILANIGNVTSYLLSQNASIALASPGSCAPNWLQGKPSTAKPRGDRSRCRASRPLYCGVNPQALAVLTISSTWPSN